MKRYGTNHKQLRRLVDPTTGKPVDGQSSHREEAYHGEHADEMPDLVYFTLERDISSIQPMALPFVSNRAVLITRSFRNPSTHAKYLVVKVPGSERESPSERPPVRSRTDNLHLAGCRVPDDMDGRVLTEFSKEAPQGTSDYLREAMPKVNHHETDLSPEDQSGDLSL